MRLLLIDDDEVAHEIRDGAWLDQALSVCEEGWTRTQDATIEQVGTEVLQMAANITGRSLFGVRHDADRGLLGMPEPVIATYHHKGCTCLGDGTCANPFRR